MKSNYTRDDFLALLDTAINDSELDIYRSLRGASDESRLKSLNVLDALQLVRRNILIKLDEETT